MIAEGRFVIRLDRSAHRCTVELDGHDLTNLLRGVEVKAHVGEVTKVSLHCLPHRVHVEGGAVLDILGFHRCADFSKREREVAVLLAMGKSNPEIAEALVVSLRTVEHHLDRMKAKAGCETVRELVALCAGGTR